MKMLFGRFWREEHGAIVSAEIMLVATILVIGVIVGLSALRDSVVTELADVAQAIANVSQSYSYSGVSGHHAFTAGGSFNDKTDFCDTPDSNGDWGNSKCVQICSSGVAAGESAGHHHGGW
jgi:Flp pilus assembly pilin Flp